MIKLASRPTQEQVATVENVLAAYLVLLHRRTLQEHITVFCRLADANEDRVGLVSVDFTEDLTVTAVARRAAAQLDDLAPADSDEAAEAAGATVSGSFQVLRDDAPADTALSGPLATVSVTGARPAVTVTAGAGGLSDGPDASALDAALRAACADASREPDTSVALLRLADDEEEDAAWRGFGRSGGQPPTARCVHELISCRAAATPDAVAVTGGGEELTYRGLEESAERLAQRLRAHGVTGDSVVAVLLPRSPRLIVTLLAVLKAGGAYLALDPEDPDHRHRQILDDSGAALLLTGAPPADRAPYGVPTLDPAGPAGETQEPTAPAGVPLPDPDALAYVSYTSGSTGEPRGVGVPHRAIARLVADPDWIDVGPEDVFLQLAPVAFDASTWEIWAPLVHGARLAVAPPGAVELDLLADILKAERVSVVWLTAGLFHQMVALHIGAFAGLRHVVAGGDVVSPSHLARLLTAHPHLRFTNGYGPTENTTFTACWTTTAPAAGDTVPIGRPVTGTHVAVLDAALRLVPPGVAGELYAAGDGLARGYVGRPAASAVSFVPDVISGVPGARMYRTGDLARWTTDGTLEFLGRADQQLKVQGFRVEPGSIEAELTRIDGVREAVVVGQPDDAGGKRLLAYVVLDETAADGAADTGDATGTGGIGAQLRERLRTTLPAAMVPWAVLVREELPLNKNGKVDRRKLPAATRVPRNVWNPFVAPRTETERRLAELWGDVLAVEPIGMEDDFFDLGGHSLLVAELLGTLKDTFDVEVPARVLYLQPTITDLAHEIGG